MAVLAPSPRVSDALRWLARRKTTVVSLFVGVCAPLMLFGMFADDVLDKERFVFDLPIQMFVHGHASPAMDQLMILLSQIGSAWFAVPFDALVTVVLLWRKQHRHAAFWLAAVGGSAALNLLAKQAFSRVRPALWVSPAPETTFSFPSGHAMQTAAIVAGLTILLWRTRWRIPMLVFGSLFVWSVGVSRIYLGVHYPSDVVAAWAASIGWVVGLSMALRVNADGAFLES